MIPPFILIAAVRPRVGRVVAHQDTVASRKKVARKLKRPAMVNIRQIGGGEPLHLQWRPKICMSDPAPGTVDSILGTPDAPGDTRSG